LGSPRSRVEQLMQKSLLERAEGATQEVFGFHLSRCDRVVEAVFRRIGVNRQAPR